MKIVIVLCNQCPFMDVVYNSDYDRNSPDIESRTMFKNVCVKLGEQAVSHDRVPPDNCPIRAEPLTLMVV